MRNRKVGSFAEEFSTHPAAYLTCDHEEEDRANRAPLNSSRVIRPEELVSRSSQGVS